MSQGHRREEVAATFNRLGVVLFVLMVLLSPVLYDLAA